MCCIVFFRVASRDLGREVEDSLAGLDAILSLCAYFVSDHGDRVCRVQDKG